MIPCSLAYFWTRVRVERSGCWTWTGHVKEGVGSVIYGKGLKRIAAHRVSWAMHGGAPITRNQHLLRTCRNLLCVHPDHIEPGQSSRLPLTDEQKRLMHAQYEAGASIATLAMRHHVNKLKVIDIIDGFYDNNICDNRYV